MKRPIITFALLGAILLLLAHSLAPAQGQTTPWYTAYYGTWNQENLGSNSWNYEVLGQPPDQVDWTGITHVVHFGNGNVVSTPPYSLFATDTTEIMYGADQNTVDYQKQLISVAHSHGVKVCLSIQAVDPTPLNTVAADSARTDVFANWIILYAKRHNYDGIELDWEGSIAPRDQVSRIVRRLRYFLDAIYSPTHAYFVMSPGLGNYDDYVASQDWCIDQYNVQLYALMWTPNDNNLTWHTCAVYPGSTTNGTQGAIDGLSNGEVGYIQQWINAGHDPAKMGLGLPTFGYVVRGADALFQSIGGGVLGHNGNMTVDQNSFCTGLLNVGGQLIWDDVRKMHYIAGTATKAYAGPNGGISQGQKFFATLASAQWIQEVVKYAKTKNFGGFMLYSLTEDLDPSKPAGHGRNIIHDALRDALSGVVGVVWPTGTFEATPVALPFGGGNVTLTWTSSNATTASIDQGIGAVSLNGSKTINVTGNTQFKLTLTDSAGTANYTASVTVSTPIVSPKPGSKNQSTTPMVRWLHTAGATRYQLQVSTDSLFKTCACNDSALVDTVRQVGPLSKSAKYYSRVRASSVAGTWGQFSSLASFTTGTIATPVESGEGVPQETALLQNYPNPFNPSTAISYQLGAATHVSLKVYDVLGQEVETLVDAPQSAGSHSSTWNAAGRSSGVYLFRLTTGDYSSTKRMVLLK
jgi:GH18 family chitinase